MSDNNRPFTIVGDAMPADKPEDLKNQTPKPNDTALPQNNTTQPAPITEKLPE